MIFFSNTCSAPAHNPQSNTLALRRLLDRGHLFIQNLKAFTKESF